MPQIVKKRRSGWAVLAAGALVASLLAVGAAPAAAIDEDSAQDAEAATSACVGAAAADAGFTDTDALGAEGAINCLAYYGITTGKTADTFDPNSNVTRSQMALFLYRTAGVMGLDLMGGDVTADFGDIADEGEERQNAINALARNGILGGRGNAVFDPGGDITRAEMAVALANLVAHIPGAPVDKNDNGTFTVDVGDGKVDVFADAFGSTSGPVNSAISAIYELGITTGYDDGTFRSNDLVPRKNMAQFITRALSHSNARPAGVIAQAAGDGITVSVRDADFRPVANAVIDAFMEDTENAAKAFKDDGTCASRFGDPVEAGTQECTVDPIDPVTGSQGNLNLSVTIAEKGTTVWVWTGDIGDKVSSSTDLYELDLTPGAGTPQAAARAEVLSEFDRDDDFRAKFGSTVTFTIQLKADVDHDDDVDTPTQEMDARPDAGGDAYTVTKTFPNGAAGVETVTLGKDGSGTFDVSAGDPDPSSRGQSVTVSFTIARKADEADPAVMSPQLDDSAPESPDLRDSYTGTVQFSDATPKPFAVKAEAVRSHSAAATSDNPTTGNRINVTVTDQYGDPIGNIAVTATSTRVVTQSNATGSTFPAKARVTFPDGTVGLAYGYTGAAQSETVTVTAETGPGVDGVPGNNDDPADLATTVLVHWTTDATEAEGTGDVLAADVDNNLLVLNVISVPTVFEYDDNDVFTVGGAFVTPAAFEENLATVLESTDFGSVAVTSYTAGDADDVGSFAWTQ